MNCFSLQKHNEPQYGDLDSVMLALCDSTAVKKPVTAYVHRFRKLYGANHQAFSSIKQMQPNGEPPLSISELGENIVII